MGISSTLLNNRSACHLELADAMSDLEGRTRVYEEAARDAHYAVIGFRFGGSSPHLSKALFRHGRALLGIQTCRNHVLETLQQRGQISKTELLSGRKKIATDLGACGVHLRSALQENPGDCMISAKLDEMEALQAALARTGAPPLSQTPIPTPQPQTFAASVLFTPGGSWIDNQVALEMTVTSAMNNVEVHLPVYLTKQENDNNMGELAIWIHLSGHLGEATLKERGAALGMDPDFDCVVGQPYGNLSTPAQGRNDIQSPDEFVAAFNWNRSAESARSIATLQEAGVISRVRSAGSTQFGEEFHIYRVNF